MSHNIVKLLFNDTTIIYFVNNQLCMRITKKISLWQEGDLLLTRIYENYAALLRCIALTPAMDIATPRMIRITAIDPRR